MRVVLLAPNPPDCVSFGPRQLASVLKLQGHEVSIVFLRGSVGRHRSDGSARYEYAPSLVDDAVERCRDADVVGVSFMSLFWDRAVQLTRAVQTRLGKPVIWGGTHPTLRPEQSVRIADFVCVGEGEIAFSEWTRRLRDGGDLTTVPGIWSRQGGAITRTGEAPEIQDLDALPWPDMDTAGHWVDFRDRLVPMTTERMFEVLPRLPHFGGRLHVGIRVMATRGCPHRCSYCASSAQNTLRRRSVRSTIDHVKWLRERYPFLQSVYEFDDTFFANSWGWLAEFAQLWREEVGLPWHCQTSPSTLTRKKLSLLVESGLVWCEMGIQSGSDEVRALFRRNETDAQVRSAAALLHEFAENGRMLPPRYHVITDNPWESPESVLETVSLLLELPRPFSLAVGSLCLFPGTALNDRARDEGWLTDEVRQVYRTPFLRARPNLLNWLIEASAVPGLPRPVLHEALRWSRRHPKSASADSSLVAGLSLATRWMERLPRAAAALSDADLTRVRRRLELPA